MAGVPTRHKIAKHYLDFQNFLNQWLNSFFAVFADFADFCSNSPFVLIRTCLTAHSQGASPWLR